VAPGPSLFVDEEVCGDRFPVTEAATFIAILDESGS
jgi:hypothetical protein